jgi:hypothetical protein
MTLEVLTAPELRHASEMKGLHQLRVRGSGTQCLFVGNFRAYLLELMMSVKADIAVAGVEISF